MEQPELVPTSAAAWKGKLVVEGRPLPLPTGNVALVRQISPQAFLESGLIPDPLRPIVNKAINDKKGLPPTAMKKIMDDPKQLAAAMQLFDQTICYVVVEPEIQMPPKCSVCGEYANGDVHGRDAKVEADHKYTEAKRNPNILYADQVDLGDKQFIFQWCMGGVSELEPFREELSATVGSVSDGQGVPSSA